MYSNNYGVVLAGFAIAAFPPILMFLLFQRHFVKGLMISGIK
jgi:ABC-type glycerol-3-phosphate transport system permease component